MIQHPSVFCKNMELLGASSLVFWDFDGVIKESNDIKCQALVGLFHHYGAEIADRVRDHHETHGGMSRFEKIPRYLEWAGETVTPELVEEYCRHFALRSLQGVIDAPWVPGVERILRTNPYRQKFVLVTATPQSDIDTILEILRLRSCFSGVHGAPLSKRDAIRMTLENERIEPLECLMIGDAREDWHAARENKVPFLLRRHATNGRVFSDYKGASVEFFV